MRLSDDSERIGGVDLGQKCSAVVLAQVLVTLAVVLLAPPLVAVLVAGGAGLLAIWAMGRLERGSEG